MARWADFLLLASILHVLTPPVAAQCGISVVECRPEAPRWVGEFTALSANAVIGGLTAGAVRSLRGGSFGDGFLAGLLGGSAVYAGKRIAAERFDGAGLLGRMVAATGTSMVNNAGAGVAPFSRLLLPAGPVLLDVRPGENVSARLDVVATGWIIYGIAEPELDFDWTRSLSAGAPVFLTDGTLLAFGGDDAHAAGVTNAGVIFVADVPAYGERVLERFLAHERIHVLQEDFVATAWTDPLVDGLLAQTPPTRALSQYVRINLSTELLRLLGMLFPEYEDRPWEIEAIFFAR